MLQRIVATVLGIVLFVAAFIFASFLFAAVAVFALTVWAWLWWRTRTLRRNRGPDGRAPIDGEYRIEREVHGERLDDPPPRSGPDRSA